MHRGPLTAQSGELARRWVGVTTSAHVPAQTIAGSLPDAQTAAAAVATVGALAVVANVQRVVRGRPVAVELVTCALLAGGHALIEDVPGSGKTTLARAFAHSLGASFSRIQATADLLPSDITGSGIWDTGSQTLRFVPGPVFAQVVLVDELNRTPPRTQSAFMEAMAEGAVTADGTRHALPDPFFVIATQNPLEQHGTYPLPEGQLDRFAVRVTLGDLDAATERAVVREQLAGPTVDALSPVLDVSGLLALRASVRTVRVSDPALEHAVELARGTRRHPAVMVGASPRAAIVLVRCAQALALLRGRDHVRPEDTQHLAGAVLAHRLSLLGAGGAHGPDAALQIVADVVSHTPVHVRA